MNRHLWAIALVLVSVGAASPAAGQSASSVPGRVEIGAGVVWAGSQALGSSDANLTTSTGSTLRLFSSTSDLQSNAGFEGRIGVRVGRAIDVEAAFDYAKPQLRTQVTNDTESSAGATVTETVQQYVIGGAIVWYPQIRNTRRRVRPFAIGGVGYLRQLHEAATLVATGQLYQIGGGAKILLASRSRKGWKAVGVRLDARVLVRTKGITFDGRRAISPAAGASLFTRF